ncbi:hypothetical protein M8C21_027073, partial [Ambrosia artemisiifolia]
IKKKLSQDSNCVNADGRSFDCIDSCSSSDELSQNTCNQNLMRKRRIVSNDFLCIINILKILMVDVVKDYNLQTGSRQLSKIISIEIGLLEVITGRLDNKLGWPRFGMGTF